MPRHGTVQSLGRALCAVAASTAVIAAMGAGTAAAATTLYVSPSGKTSAADTSCTTAKYTSIQAAVQAAAAGGKVVVCPGTYRGSVAVPKPITLAGEHATINAAGSDTGITIAASGATVAGFTVENALGEGILAVGKPGAPLSHVTIRGNTVRHNDLGNPTGGPISKSKYRECNASGHIPGDCGEGIHLMVVVNSTVADNTVTGNAGGILLSDEFGPTAHNTIENNVVTNNVLDCGITIVSHNGGGYVKGKTVPDAGGTYDNTIENNHLVGNGTKGQGSGVVMATPMPGGAVYGNVIKGNVISGNGQGGVTLHSHAPGQDLSGNVIEDNTIGTNNLAGDFDFSPHVDKVHTGIIVASAASPVQITITGNRISNDVDGIWHLGPVTITGATQNTFTHVTNTAVAG